MTIDQGGNFSVNLICNGVTERLSPPIFASLPSMNMPPIPIPLQLTSSLVGANSTSCQLEASLNGNAISSNVFQVSNLVQVTVSSNDTEFKPGDQVSIQGDAVKVNGQSLNGIVGLNVLGPGNTSIYQISNSVSNGYFSFNFSLPSEIAAGQYFVVLNAYETDPSGAETNVGYYNFNILVDQVPTSLNLVPQNILFRASIPGARYKC